MDIPIVDVQQCLALVDQQAANHILLNQISQQLHQAFVTHGCCYLRNHGIPEKIFSNLNNESKKFFELPQEEKNKFTKLDKDKEFTGYYKSCSDEFRERFDYLINDEFKKRIPEILVAVIKEYVDSMRNLTDFVLRAMSMSLGSSGNLLEYHAGVLGTNVIPTNTHLSSLRYLLQKGTKYPEILHNEHTDISCLTFLKTTSPGLQLQVDINGEDSWVDVTPIDDCILVQIGDQMEMLSGGIYKAAKHQVRNTCDVDMGCERFSIVYFIHPDCEATVKPLTGDVTKYPAIKSDAYWKNNANKRTKINSMSS